MANISNVHRHEDISIIIPSKYFIIIQILFHYFFTCTYLIVLWGFVALSEPRWRIVADGTEEIRNGTFFTTHWQGRLLKVLDCMWTKMSISHVWRLVDDAQKVQIVPISPRSPFLKYVLTYLSISFNQNNNFQFTSPIRMPHLMTKTCKFHLIKI